MKSTGPRALRCCGMPCALLSAYKGQCHYIRDRRTRQGVGPWSKGMSGGKRRRGGTGLGSRRVRQSGSNHANTLAMNMGLNYKRSTYHAPHCCEDTHYCSFLERRGCPLSMLQTGSPGKSQPHRPSPMSLRANPGLATQNIST